ncbi:hypothetical protein AVEN_183572-1 [Araneus ventricosus]|uniref:Uncharacterized protein n=1 Tax=Araneus ventricosus TaxID=182803 RepID=A0A4Y2GZ71_ARAVE|nr:hypothetical protein AVEN_183572-1 [Araneus ventricosus]
MHFTKITRGRRSLVVRSRFRNRKSSRFENRFQRRSVTHVDLVRVKRPPAGLVRRLGESVTAQALASSADHGSKLGDPFLVFFRFSHSPPIASKREM